MRDNILNLSVNEVDDKGVKFMSNFNEIFINDQLIIITVVRKSLRERSTVLHSK